ncbi:hypothetical protein PR202_ga22701 [Eleusine coracana subsp. coracana]|uniref:Uncharacterized protein n=1 Tax=Eleusine coracana subsp. coracana TaxID=191504 RepID=A0AAV5D4C2_ELECO|nr:hypothetical protein PR202_ga22701 [Eleusine coracana subsp. coracana]
MLKVDLTCTCTCTSKCRTEDDREGRPPCDLLAATTCLHASNSLPMGSAEDSNGRRATRLGRWIDAATVRDPTTTVMRERSGDGRAAGRRRAAAAGAEVGRQTEESRGELGRRAEELRLVAMAATGAGSRPQ